jgi:hypothetical protein
MRGRSGALHAIEERKKAVFFEEKNQKTFSSAGSIRAPWLNSRRDATGKSFLLLFFKKEAFL